MFLIFQVTLHSLLYSMFYDRIFSQGALYGMAQKVPDRSLVREIASTFVEMCYVTTKLPANSSSDGVSENHLCNGL